MNELLTHYTNLQTILTKIIKSQSEDTKIAIEQLSSSIDDLNTVKTQLDICRTLAEKQSEEINALTKKSNALKRVRIVGIASAGTGLVMGVTGLVLREFDESENIGRFLLASGTTLLVSGGVTIVFSIPLW